MLGVSDSARPGCDSPFTSRPVSPPPWGHKSGTWNSFLSELNSPARASPVNASPASCEDSMHDSGSGRLASALSGKFPPLLWASFRRQLCCATLKDARPSCVARLTVNENPSQINNANFPDSTLGLPRTALSSATPCRFIPTLSAPPTLSPSSSRLGGGCRPEAPPTLQSGR